MSVDILNSDQIDVLRNWHGIGNPNGDYWFIGGASAFFGSVKGDHADERLSRLRAGALQPMTRGASFRGVGVPR